MNSQLFKTSAMTGVRMMSAAANHVPPKKLHGINGRYAGAVYTAASKVSILIAL